MSLKRVAIVVGTRPEAIKLAPVVRALQSFSDIDLRLIATGQHREMLAEAMAETGLAADLDLDLMRPSQTLSGFLSTCLARLGEVFAEERPDYVIAQGDTGTVHAAALAAFHARIPFGHVEAGLRTASPDAPFPEETNRRAVSLLARHHFCPTAAAKANLLRERIPTEAIHVAGNTVIDTLLDVAASLDPASPDTSQTILVTVHRRENFDALRAIAAAVGTLLDRVPDLRILWPIHPNPSLGDTIHAVLGDHPRVELTGHMPYRHFVRAMRDARLTLTDSGGVQEEAPALGTPVLVLRNETERPEGILAGVARLVGNDPQGIVEAAIHLLTDEAAHGRMARGASPYGDGLAGKRIAEIIHTYLTEPPLLRSPVATG